MDDVDREIIAILRRDAKTPFSQIAKRLNVGADTVVRRFGKLIQQGIISNPTIFLDSYMCGFEGLVDFLIKIKSGANAEEIRVQLTKLENVILTAKTLGDHDLYCSVFFRNFGKMIEISEQIKKIEDIISVEPIIYVAQKWAIPLNSDYNPTYPSALNKDKMELFG
jgi:Lrp/AsnC family transcriptional regulator for asnA, asnC and gidA